MVGGGNMPGGHDFGPRRNLRRNKRKLQSECSAFHMYFYGGDIYVNAGADGLDANGNIVISGGNLEIWGASTGADGDFLDYYGDVTISGGTLFGGGNAGMITPSNWKNSQNKILGSYSVSANSVVNIMSGTTTIKSYTAPKNVGYLYYTSPDADSNYKFSIGTSSSTSGNNSSSTDTDEADTSDDASDDASDDDSDDDDIIEFFNYNEGKIQKVEFNILFMLLFAILL